MPHSYSRLIIHLTFSTKDRRQLIDDAIRGQLHGYLIGILRNLDSPSIRLNTVEDHGHIVFLLAKSQPLDQIIEEVKRSSSKWIKTKSPAYTDFHWQIGYAAFSVGQEDLDRVTDYIDRQPEHHRRLSFMDEIRELFRQAGQPLDEEHFFE